MKGLLDFNSFYAAECCRALGSTTEYWRALLSTPEHCRALGSTPEQWGVLGSTAGPHGLGPPKRCLLGAEFQKVSGEEEEEVTYYLLLERGLEASRPR